MERETGFEPATFCLGSRYSTTELLPRRFGWLQYNVSAGGSQGRLCASFGWTFRQLKQLPRGRGFEETIRKSPNSELPVSRLVQEGLFKFPSS